MATGQAKNRHVDIFHLRVVYCTVVAIWIYLVIYNWFSYMNLPQSKDVESLLRTEIHAGSTNFSWQFVRDCFVHV